MNKKNKIGSSENISIRKKAEAILEKKILQVDRSLSEADSLKLLHELQVHQIEIEIQNEELRAERDKAETASKKYFDLYSEIYDFTPTGYFTLSAEGNICEVNLRGSKLFGIDRSRLINSNFRFFLSLDSRLIFNDFLNRVFENNSNASCDITIERRDAPPVFAYIEGTLSENDNRCLATVVDITDRKKAENDLLHTTEKLNFALESGNIGLWEWDLKTNVVNWDERTERIFGLDQGSFGRTYSAFENSIHDEDLLHFREAINQTLNFDYPFETVFRNKTIGDDSKYITTKGHIYKDKSGIPVNLTGVCFDITSMKKGAEKVIIKLNEELLRSNTDLQQFAYVASHDLQEPLRMISSFTQLLAQRYEGKLDKQAQEYIKFTVDGSKRMYALLNGLMEYSRVHTKGKEFIKVNMNKVIDKVKQNLSLKIAEKNGVIESEILPVINSDESQMIQLVQNLVENSLKFSNNTPHITISSQSENNYWIFSVKDGGIGIESQYFERIFSIFQRLHLKEAYEGTGVGLAICKRIVERHGGKIWVESEPGKGSTFYFSIPKINPLETAV
jgi:two-component system, chemotaxis family, sensor kinase Cph1